jgi:glycosyltransferase involved in cell wall biosynthesis
MPVRDAAATLAAALGSLQAQTDPDWELLAVDDGSADDSPGILEEWAARDRRIRALRQPRRGLVPALSRGLEEARAPLIARMDADDVSLPERLQRQRCHLAARAGVGLVGCRVVFGGDRQRQAGFARHVDWINALVTHEAIALARFVESPLAHPSVMFRRQVAARWGAWREGDFPEDYELWLRWLEAGVRMEKVDEPLLVWNDRPDRLSRRDPRYAADAFYRVKAGYLARWLAAHNPHHPVVTVWGAGRVTRRRVRGLVAEGARVAAWVDIDPRKIGRVLDGSPVVGPERLPPPGQGFVVSFVAAAGARDLIESALRGRGYRAGIDYVLAA